MTSITSVQCRRIPQAHLAEQKLRQTAGDAVAAGAERAALENAKGCPSSGRPRHSSSPTNAIARDSPVAT
jgi:hypothetical protein